MITFDPLEHPTLPRLTALDIDSELLLARKLLAELGQANIHDRDAMVVAATSLHMRLGALADAVASERGERQ